MGNTTYPFELDRTLTELLKAGHITAAEYFTFLNRLRDGEAPKVTDELYRKGKITPRQYDKVVRAIERDRKARSKAKTNEAFDSIDRGYGRRGSPVAQGGLPSLGKRRP